MNSAGRPSGYRKDRKIALTRVINFAVKKRQYDAIKEFNAISFDKFSKLVRAEIIKKYGNKENNS